VNVGLWLERFDEALRLRGRTERTRESYGYEVRLFLRFLDARDVDIVASIGRQDLDAYRLHLHHWRKPDGNPLSLSAQAGKLGPVLSFLRYLHEDKQILVNPGQGVRLPKVPDNLPACLPDEEQVLKLLETPDVSAPLGLRDRAIMELLYSSAIRNTELRLLEVEHLDLVRLQLRIEQGKGRKGRMVPLGEPAAQWLETYLRDGRPWLLREPFPATLFLNSLGRMLSRETLTEMVREHAQKAGLPSKVTPHILRHCCATHMLARRAGLRHLQQLLGHASADTTKRYTRVEISDLREVHQRCHPREAL
jgi:integrase/recombinase XerD